MGATETPTALEPAPPVPASLRGLWIWVWEDTPAPDGLRHLTGAIVRAANGNGVVGGGVDFAANYAKWAHAYGAARCAAWTWIYGAAETSNQSHTDGAAAAHALASSAPHAPAYVADVESNVAPEEVVKFFSTVSSLRPGVPVGFSSYPTRHQASQFGVPWSALVAHCDFGAPQVYFADQGAQIGQVYADHDQKPVQIAFAPDDWAAWVEAARLAIRRNGGASIWRFPVKEAWKDAIASLAREHGGGLPRVDVTVSLPQLDLSNAAAAHVTDASVSLLKALLVTHGKLASPPPWSDVADTAVRDAVRAFQAASGLDADAVVGPLTWAELVGG